MQYLPTFLQSRDTKSLTFLALIFSLTSKFQNVCYCLWRIKFKDELIICSCNFKVFVRMGSEFFVVVVPVLIKRTNLILLRFDQITNRKNYFSSVRNMHNTGNHVLTS